MLLQLFIQTIEKNSLSVLGTPNNMILQGVYIPATMRNIFRYLKIKHVIHKSIIPYVQGKCKHLLKRLAA